MNINSKKLQKAIAMTKKYRQQHLLRFFDEISHADQENLLNQILNIDYELVSFLYKNTIQHTGEKRNFTNLEPIETQVWSSFEPDKKANLTNLGWKAIRQGKVAAFLVAGGQGTRLEYEKPKGTFNIGMPSNKSLFQLQTERLINLSSQAGNNIPWYIMTSPENNEDTINYFADHHYFGYNTDDLKFFSQVVFPTIDKEGRILLADKSNISMCPNGNGGCLSALKNSDALNDMKKRGVEWIFIYSVDNALVKVADPRFIGFAINSEAKAAAKTVKKTSPEEKVAVFCRDEGRTEIIEYSELPEELANKTCDSGELLFSDGSIAIHLFNLDFLEKCAEKNLPYHLAFKKINTIDESERPLYPEEPNGYKFEQFMFDIFTLAPNLAALRVNREDEFAPVKNRDGVDSPATARELSLNMHQRWLINSGIDKDMLLNKQIEISPLTSYNGENIDINQFMKQYDKEVILL